jgi:hypothetical protein
MPSGAGRGRESPFCSTFAVAVVAAFAGCPTGAIHDLRSSDSVEPEPEPFGGRLLFFVCNEAFEPCDDEEGEDSGEAPFAAWGCRGWLRRGNCGLAACACIAKSTILPAFFSIMAI